MNRDGIKRKERRIFAPWKYIQNRQRKKNRLEVKINIIRDMYVV